MRHSYNKLKFVDLYPCCAGCFLSPKVAWKGLLKTASGSRGVQVADRPTEYCHNFLFMCMQACHDMDGLAQVFQLYVFIKFVNLRI